MVTVGLFVENVQTIHMFFLIDGVFDFILFKNFLSYYNIKLQLLLVIIEPYTQPVPAVSLTTYNCDNPLTLSRFYVSIKLDK